MPSLFRRNHALTTHVHVPNMPCGKTGKAAASGLLTYLQVRPMTSLWSLAAKLLLILPLYNQKAAVHGCHLKLRATVSQTYSAEQTVTA